MNFFIVIPPEIIYFFCKSFCQQYYTINSAVCPYARCVVSRTLATKFYTLFFVHFDHTRHSSNFMSISSVTCSFNIRSRLISLVDSSRE